MKKVFMSFCICLSTLLLIGCSAQPGDVTTSTKASSIVQPPDLTGTWKQSNSETEDAYQEAVISGDTIEIYWVSNGGDTKALYWAGSYAAPVDATEPYSWDSKNDTEKTATALMASSDDTKTITYEKQELSYSVSALGMTTKVRLQKQ